MAGMRQLKIQKSITNRDSASLDKYLTEIGKEKLITADQEIELAQKIKQGDEGAKDKLVRANLRFVVSVAKQYQNQGLSLPDLINEGNLGLIKAAGRFDETRGFKFISYAVWWIRQQILQSLAEQSRIVRLPLTQVSTLNKNSKTTAKMEQDLERPPSPEELSEVIGILPEQIRNIIKVGGRHLSFDAPFAEGETNGLMDIIPDKDATQADAALLADGVKMAVHHALGLLTERERDVVKLFYGIGIPHGMTLEEIGLRFDLTRERVRQIKEKAIRRMKHSGRIRYSLNTIFA